MMRSRVRLLPFILVLLAFAPRPAEAAIDRWTPLGPDGGTITVLATDPQIHGTLYAGAAGGAVWKSLDGGAHWFAASEGFASSDITALSVAWGGSGRVWAGTPGGIYQTESGGASWQRVWSVPGLPDRSLDHWILSLATDPADPEVAWGGTWSGVVLRTTDGGASWVEIPLKSGAVNDITVDPQDPEVVYVAAGQGIFKSTDGGITWPRIRAEGALTLLIDPVAPRTLYATGFSEIWRSTDAGATWTQLPGPEGVIYGLLAHPLDPSILLAGTSAGLMRSEDAGATWQQVEGLPFLLSFTFAADTSGRLWLGANDRGVFRSLDGGHTWRASRQGLGATLIWDVEIDPFRPRTLYAVAQGIGLHRSTDGGATWKRSNTGLPASGGYGVLLDDLAPHPLIPGTLYAGSGAGLYRSRDRGTHWSAVLHQGDIRSVAFSPRNPQEIFAGGDSLFRSRDGGRTWKMLSRPATSYDSEIATVLVSPLRPRLVYFLDINERRGDAKSLFRSLDGGESSRLVFEGGATALAFHPTLARVQVLATAFGGAIWKSVNQGTTWQRIAEGVGNDRLLTALLFDRVDPSVLYLGTDGAGVWRSLDGGVTWAPLSTGMIAPRITSLEIDPRNPRRLLAGTQGGGVLEIRLTTP